MRSFRNLGLIALAAALVLIPLLLGAQEKPAQPAQPAKIAGATLMPPDELKWEPMPGLEGVKQARLWGDPTQGAHGIFYKWPAGTKAPLHSHTHGDRGIVISGTLTLGLAGGATKPLGPGSYFSLAGGTKHTTASGDAECLFFIEREGPFDVVMADEQKAK